MAKLQISKFIPTQAPPEQKVNDFLAQLQQGAVPVAQDDLSAQSLGFQAWNYNPGIVGNTSALVAGTVYATGIYLAGGVVVTNIDFIISTAAAGTDPTGVYVGLVDPSGNVRAVSNNVGGLAGWKSANLGFVRAPLSAPFTVSPAETGLWYAMLLQVGSWGTTQPVFKRGLDWVGGGINGALAYGTLGTLQTALPAVGSVVTLSNAATPHNWIVGVD